MDFTDFYGSKKQQRLKLAEMLLIFLMNLFTVCFLILGSMAYSLAVSISAVVPIFAFIARNQNIRFVRLNLLSSLLLFSIMIMAFMLASSRW